MKLISKVWPQWTVEEQIGKGSYGTVYKCVKNQGGNTEYSAVKVISVPQSDDEQDTAEGENISSSKEETKVYYKDIADDLVKEIELLKELRGTKNIVEIYDAEVVPKTSGIGWYILIRMELLEDFNTYAAGKKFTEKDVIKLGIDLSDALSVCHKAKIIHRDIKPENIFVDKEGNFKLGDFGVAKQMEKTKCSMSVKGTYNFMSPEVYSGKKCDSRADLYSLGLVMYKLLNNNRLPFVDPNKELVRYHERQEAFERRIRGEKLPAIDKVSDELNDVILRACAYKSSERQKDIDEFRHQLQLLMGGRRVKSRVRAKAAMIRTVFVCFILVLAFGAIAAYDYLNAPVYDYSLMSEPELINTGFYSPGKNSINSKYCFCGSDGIYIYDEAGEKTVRIYEGISENAVFNGKEICYYAVNTEASSDDTDTAKGNFCCYELETDTERIIAPKINSYSGASIYYFDDSKLIYTVENKEGKANLMSCETESGNDRAVGHNVNDYIFVLEDNIIFSADTDKSGKYSPILIYDISKQVSAPITNRGIADRQSCFYNDGYFYFAEIDTASSSDGDNICISSYHISTGITNKKLALLEGVTAKDIVSISDSYALTKSESGYTLWSFATGERTSVRLPSDFGEIVNAFTLKQLSDNIILSVSYGAVVRLYEIKESGRLRVFAESEKIADKAETVYDFIYSISSENSEDKEAYVYEVRKK